MLWNTLTIVLIEKFPTFLIPISFLDLFLVGNTTTGTIKTTTFRKETAGNTILSANSCHPIHTIKAISIGEFVRAKCYCSTEMGFSIEKNNICDRLHHRKYPQWMLNRAINKVDNLSRN